MTTETPPLPSAHRPPADSISEATLLDVAKAVSGVGEAVDGSVIVMRAWGGRALLLMWCACGAILVAVAGIVWMLARSYEQAARLEAVAAQVEKVAEQQAQNKAATEKVAEKVDEAKATAADNPTIEIAPATSATPGAKAKGAVLVIKPSRRKPSATSASAPPPAPEIEIPIKLPPEVTAVPGASSAPPAPKKP